MLQASQAKSDHAGLQESTERLEAFDAEEQPQSIPKDVAARQEIGNEVQA